MSDDVDVVVTLHALATYAENANHWTDDKRMMDASGVADTIYEAMDRIEELEADLRKMALDCLAADGQAAEAHQAQLAAKAKLVAAMEEVATYSNDPHLAKWAYSALAELKEAK